MAYQHSWPPICAIDNVMDRRRLHASVNQSSHSVAGPGGAQELNLHWLTTTHYERWVFFRVIY